MEAYALALTYAIPIFLALIGIEAIVSLRMGMKINRGPDMISSMGSGVFSMTALMDKASYAWIAELVKCLLVITIMMIGKWDWFGLAEVLPNGNYLVITFTLFSLIGVIYFHCTEVRNNIIEIKSGVPT